MLFKLGIFDINLSTIFSFLFGLAVGLAIFALIYLALALSTMRSKKYIVKTAVKDVTSKEIEDMIAETQIMFKDKKLRGEKSMIAHAKDLSTDLVKNIAIKFFPKSKHPLLEISIDELLLLGVYISKRLDEVLDHKGLRLFRKLKISTIVSMGEIKQNIEDHPLVKATKKYKIAEAFKAAKSVINIVNPVYWVKKAIVNTAMDVILKKLCVIIIGICGEETFKIYSKSVFNVEPEIDSGIQELIDEVKQDVDDIEEEEGIEEVKKRK